MRRNRSRPVELTHVNRVVDELELPAAVWKTCPWQPRELVERGLRQWLRCAGAALRDGQTIGMPSHAVDEAWHGFILCTPAYAAFCAAAYGRFLHHHPEGGGTEAVDVGPGDPMADQLGRTVVAWGLAARPGEACVLWDLDAHIGVDEPWGVPADRVSRIEAEVSARDAGASARRLG